MALVREYRDALDEPIEIETKHITLLDYLQEHHKDGFNQPVDVFMNDVLLEVSEYRIKLFDDDIINIVFKPADPGTILINIAVSFLVAVVVNALFPEDEPSMPTVGSTDYRSIKNPQSVYSLNSNNNSFAAGQTIPVIYGAIKSTPSLIAPPYRKYIGNEEYLYQLFCLGAGDIDIDDILISDTSSTNVSSDSFIYKKISQD